MKIGGARGALKVEGLDQYRPESMRLDENSGIKKKKQKKDGCC